MRPFLSHTPPLWCHFYGRNFLTIIYSCSVLNDSHWSHVSVDCLKCGWFELRYAISVKYILDFWNSIKKNVKYSFLYWLHIEITMSWIFIWLNKTYNKLFIWFFSLHFNVANRKLKIIHVACIILLLDRDDWYLTFKC